MYIEKLKLNDIQKNILPAGGVIVSASCSGEGWSISFHKQNELPRANHKIYIEDFYITVTQSNGDANALEDELNERYTNYMTSRFSTYMQDKEDCKSVY